MFARVWPFVPEGARAAAQEEKQGSILRDDPRDQKVGSIILLLLFENTIC